MNNIQGQDQRYPISNNQTHSTINIDEIDKHILNFMRIELLDKLKSDLISSDTKLELIKYSDIPSINTNSIKPFNIKSGGLMSDWNESL